MKRHWAFWRQEIAREKGFYPGSSEPEVGQFLFALCRMVEAKRVLEVGCWKGVTTLWLMEAVDGIGEVWAIDKANNLSTLVPIWGELRFVLGESTDEIPKLPGLFDLVFLDANHAYAETIRELQALMVKVKKGGIICCHDVDSFQGVRDAVGDMQQAGLVARVDLMTPITPGRWPGRSGLAVLRKMAD